MPSKKYKSSQESEISTGSQEKDGMEVDTEVDIGEEKSGELSFAVNSQEEELLAVYEAGCGHATLVCMFSRYGEAKDGREESHSSGGPNGE